MHASAKALESATSRRSVTADVRLGHILGGDVDIIGIELLDTGFEVRYRALGDLDHVMSNPNGFPCIHGPWTAEDDAGGSYRGIGGECGGWDPYWRGTIRFAPAVDARATTLTVWPEAARSHTVTVVLPHDRGR